MAPPRRRRARSMDDVRLQRRAAQRACRTRLQPPPGRRQASAQGRRLERSPRLVAYRTIEPWSHHGPIPATVFDQDQDCRTHSSREARDLYSMCPIPMLRTNSAKPIPRSGRTIGRVQWPPAHRSVRFRRAAGSICFWHLQTHGTDSTVRAIQGPGEVRYSRNRIRSSQLAPKFIRSSCCVA